MSWIEVTIDRRLCEKPDLRSCACSGVSVPVAEEHECEKFFVLVNDWESRGSFIQSRVGRGLTKPTCHCVLSQEEQSKGLGVLYLSLVIHTARSREHDAYRGQKDLREALCGSVKHKKRHGYSDAELRYAPLQKAFVEVNMFVS